MAISPTSAKAAERNLTADEALERILARVSPLPPREVPLMDALGRTLAQDVAADRDVPPFRNSAMDGYAVRGADVAKAPARLRVIGSVQAGGVPESAVGPGEAMRIMTGAPMPDGADTVVRVEDTDDGRDQVSISAITPTGLSVRQAGEDLKAGETILRAGTVLRAAEIGVLASIGIAKPRVTSRPRVAVLSTGDEVVDVSEPLAPGKIRDTNRYSLAAAIFAAGCAPWLRPIVRDTADDLRRALRDAMDADAIVTSGGVSVGDHDWVKPVVGELGSIDLWSIAIRPERIRSLEWMGEATKEQALRKLNAFAVKMGYPDKWRDHAPLEIDRSSYAGNVLRANEWLMRRDLDKLGQPVDRTEWRMSPQTVNAYYNPLMNEIVFPAGILQPPFFYADADDAVNYGAIGMVIGHEMSHGFDDSGSKYDADGNLKEWWQPDDRKAYEARTDLIVKQFEGYEPLAGMRINGKLTLGENIGDLGGIKIAWAAFQRALERRGRPEKIDGFTPEQRFFLGLAQSWRGKLRDEALRMRLTIDPHSPGHYRVIGPLSNMPEFHQAFSVEAGRPMRRPDEVRPTIW